MKHCAELILFSLITYIYNINVFLLSGLYSHLNYINEYISFSDYLDALPLVLVSPFQTCVG